MKRILPFLALLILTGAGCIAKTAQTPEPEQVVCTMEAKQCPDGSYVGRSGPKCEFAACPSEASCEGRACPQAKAPQTIVVGGIVSFQIPAHCRANAGAGTTYVVCPTPDNETPTPEFSFSSDGTQVNMRRYEDMESPYWKDVLDSMKVIQPLTHKIQINIDQ